MHCNSIFRKGAFFIVISMLLSCAFGCRRVANTLSNPDDNGGYASDASRIELYNDDAISITDAAGVNYNSGYIGTEGCVTVATDTTDIPHTIIVRFGNCAGFDGKVRSGSIIVSYNGEYTDPGQVHTITFDNYFINSTQLTGSIQTIRIDTTITGNWYYRINVNDSLNMSQDPQQSQYVVWNGSLVRKWVQGYSVQGTDSMNRSQQIFSVSGSATLTRANLHVFTFSISTPLQVAIDCGFVESGVVNVSGYDGPRILNYGTGTCDPNAQLAIGVNTYEITLTP